MISDQQIRGLEQRIKSGKTRQTDWQLHRQIIDQITDNTNARLGKKP